MIFGAGSRNAVVAAQRGASLASAHSTLALLPLRAAGYASVSGADPRVGAARTVDASRSCLAALGAAGRGARWTRDALAINAVAATALTVSVAGYVIRSTAHTSHALMPLRAAACASASAAHLASGTTTAAQTGFVRGTTHTSASVGVASEALAAITRSG
jgi:hypothetical protein